MGEIIVTPTLLMFQDVIDKQKNAKKMKAGMATSGKPGLLGAAERVRSMVNHELDIATTLKDAIQASRFFFKFEWQFGTSIDLTFCFLEPRIADEGSSRVVQAAE